MFPAPAKYIVGKNMPPLFFVSREQWRHVFFYLQNTRTNDYSSTITFTIYLPQTKFGAR